MGGSSQAAAAMTVQEGCSWPKPKASVPPCWILNTPDELDASALMDLVMARAAVLAAMRMTAPESLPQAGERLAASMQVEHVKGHTAVSEDAERRQELDQEPMVVATHMINKDQACKDQPCYVHPALTSELCWRDIDNLREQRRELLLRGLPARLCSAGSIGKLLGAVALDGAAECVRAQCAPGRRVGHAILRVKTAADLKRVAHFFHGWKCGNSMPIAVSFFAGNNNSLLGARPLRGEAARARASLRSGSAPPPPRKAGEKELQDSSQSTWARKVTA